MTTYKYTISSITPLQVKPGDNCECKSDDFKIKKGDVGLNFGRGEIEGSSGTFEITRCFIFELENGSFTVTVPSEAKPGTYMIRFYFQNLSGSNNYELSSTRDILRVSGGATQPMSMTSLTPKILPIKNASRTIMVTGQNLTDAQDFLFRRTKGSGPATLMLRVIETGERFANISISTPQSLLQPGTFRLEAQDPKSGSTVKCPTLFSLTQSSDTHDSHN